MLGFHWFVPVWMEPHIFAIHKNNFDDGRVNKNLLKFNSLHWLRIELRSQPKYNNRRIRVIEFCCLKPGFRRILSSNARKWAWKVLFHKPCTLAVSESEFDHANRFPGLKVGVLVYTVSRLSKCLSIDHSMVAWWVALLLGNRPWKRLHNFSVFRHARCWEWTTQLPLKLCQSFLRFFNCAYLFAWWRLHFYLCLTEITQIHLLVSSTVMIGSFLFLLTFLIFIPIKFAPRQTHQSLEAN